RHWQAHIQALGKSGLSRAEYCRRHNISYHAMTYWLRKNPKRNTSQPTLVPVPFQTGLHIPAPSSSGNVVRVVLPGDVAIEVNDNFSPSTLASVLSVLEARR
ncbi:MAG: hypothetical protein ABR512_16170, partial [Desulfopila sp.]